MCPITLTAAAKLTNDRSATWSHSFETIGTQFGTPRVAGGPSMDSR